MAERPVVTASTKAPAWTELNELTSSSLGGKVGGRWFAKMLVSSIFEVLPVTVAQM